VHAQGVGRHQPDPRTEGEKRWEPLLGNGINVRNLCWEMFEMLGTFGGISERNVRNLVENCEDC
jgi:hypothetical protein